MTKEIGKSRLLHCNEVDRDHLELAARMAEIMPEGFAAVVFSQHSPAHSIAILDAPIVEDEDRIMSTVSAFCGAIAVKAHNARWVRSFIMNTLTGAVEEIQDTEVH